MRRKTDEDEVVELFCFTFMQCKPLKGFKLTVLVIN